MSYTVPNWYQSLIAQSVGLNPNKISVGHEDDTRIVFLQYDTHQTIVVEKKTGQHAVR